MRSQLASGGLSFPTLHHQHGAHAGALAAVRSAVAHPSCLLPLASPSATKAMRSCPVRPVKPRPQGRRARLTSRASGASGTRQAGADGVRAACFQGRARPSSSNLQAPLVQYRAHVAVVGLQVSGGLPAVFFSGGHVVRLEPQRPVGGQEELDLKQASLCSGRPRPKEGRI